MKIEIDTSENQTAIQRTLDGKNKLRKVKRTNTTLFPSSSMIQVNEFDDGSWDVWVLDGTPEDGSAFCVASSLNKPQRHFDE